MRIFKVVNTNKLLLGLVLARASLISNKINITFVYKYHINILLINMSLHILYLKSTVHTSERRGSAKSIVRATFIQTVQSIN